MKRRIFSIFFALVLVLSMSLVTAVPAAGYSYGGYTGAITKTADRLVDLQSPTDFGWDWEVTDATAHSGGASGSNLYGVTALGLIDAYQETTTQSYLDAAGHTAEHITAGVAEDFWNVYGYGQDYRFLMAYALEAEDITYSDYAKAAWACQKVEKAHYASAEAWWTWARDGGGRSVGCCAWQGSACGLAALAMGDTAWANDMAAVVSSHISEISNEAERFIGWGQALEFLNAVNSTAYAADIATLIDKLTENQNEDGSWGIGENTEGYAQDAAYAIMGLAVAGGDIAIASAKKGANWLVTNQDYADIVGGWNNSTNNIEYSETDSEALQALASVVPLFLDAPYYEPGDTVTVTVGDSDANTHSAYIDTVEVTAKNNFGDEVEEIVLEETGVNSGVFTGSFQTTDQWPAPEGQLYVEDYEEFNAAGDYIPGSMVNDIITVTYGIDGETATAAINNDWPEGVLTLPDEVVNNNPIPVDASSTTTNPEYGLGYDLVIFVVTIDAPQALKVNNIDFTGSKEPPGGVKVVDGNLVGYWGPAGGFPLPASYDITSDFLASISEGPLGIYTVTVDLLDLTFPEEGGATYGANEYHVLVSASDTFEVVAAEPLMVSVSPEEVSVKEGIEGTADIVVTFQGSDFKGPDGPTGNKLDTVKVTLSGPGVDLESEDFDGTNGKGQATTSTTESLTFSVTPEQAGTITVKVVGTLDDPEAEPVTKPLTVDVTGYLIEETWADVGMETTGAISLSVTNEAGIAVNTGIVTITHDKTDGFAKDVAGNEEMESFQKIIINGSTGEITYDAGDAEDFLVSDGNYEVTGITFANIGDVEVLVTDAGDEPKAHFLTAFSVLGIGVYTLTTFEPASLTAGVDAAGLLEITITENTDPAIDVDKIFIGGVDKAFTQDANVYTITGGLLYLEAKTGDDALDVMARNALGTEYGTATLEVELPTLTAVITEVVDTTDVERDLMLVGAAYDYTIAVTVLDAQEEPLALGKVWLGTYDEAATPSFVLLDATGGHPAVANLASLNSSGEGTFTIDQIPDDTLAEGLLAWKVGDSGAGAHTDAALLSTPTIAVEAASLSLDWIPAAPEVGEAITFTVTDNYGGPAGDINVTIVTPGGDPIEKVTTPMGVFMYTPTEDGDYYVSVGEQDPVTVTVVVTRLVSIAASPSAVPLIYVGEIAELTITATYEDTSDADVTATATYASDDETVATVSDAGIITAVAEGEATITVTYTEGVLTKTADVLVTVTPVPVLVSIAASPLSVSLNLVDTQQLAITATYSDASTAVVTADATYASDAESVATVSIGGLITAVAEGTAIITVTYTEDEIPVTTEVPVTVTPVPVVEDVVWSCPLDYEALIAPFPANDRAFLSTAADLSEVTCGDADWFQILWLDEETGEWKFFYSGFAENTLLTLEPDQYYYVIVSAPCDLTIPQ